MPDPEKNSEPGWAPAFKEHSVAQGQGLPDPLGQWGEGAVCEQPAEARLESSRAPKSVYYTVSFWIFIRKKVSHPLEQDVGRLVIIPFPSPGGARRGALPDQPQEKDRRPGNS